jgi:hypothetical protein
MCTVKRIGMKRRRFPCCGRAHPAVAGLVDEAGAHVALWFAGLFDDGGEPTVWLALGSGPWCPERDPRCCFVTVRMWRGDGGVNLAITDARESPWTSDDLPPDARLLDRDEALAQPGARDWVLAMADRIAVEEHSIREMFA